MLVSYSKIYTGVIIVMGLSACATYNGVSEQMKPIDNPFAESNWGGDEEKGNITLRTRRGDQMVEVELPQKYGASLEVPMNPKFMTNSSAKEGSVDLSYHNLKPTMADREIASTFSSTGNYEDAKAKRDIEMTLGLQESDEAPQMDESYLAKIDVVKQLFKSNRFEAALIEIDAMIKDYPTSAKLFEMRGTVLDRMGYRDLALRSWKQSLEFNPNQLALKKIVTRRETQREIASEGRGE